MRFQKFYMKQIEEEIFYETFNKFYDKGYYGDIEREVIEEQQKEWYYKLIDLINERNESELVHSLSNNENKLTREWFSIITGFDVKHTSRENVINKVKLFIYGI